MSLRVKPRLQRQKDLLQKQRIHPSPIIPQKEVSNNSSHNNNSNQNSNIAQAPLLNNEVGSNNVYDISDIKIDDENNNNRNSIPITQPIEKLSLSKTNSMVNE